MNRQSRDFGRIWRRTIGLGAFALFVVGLLVAMDLEEVVVLAAALAALCAFAGLLTLTVVRYRRGLWHGLTGAARVTAQQLVRLARRTGSGGRGLAGASVRAGRSAGLVVAAAGAETARATRAGSRRSLPVLRRADAELGARVRTLATASRRRAAHALEVVVADIHAHQDAIRTADRRRSEARPIARRSPAVRRADARRSVAEPRRDRA